VPESWRGGWERDCRFCWGALKANHSHSCIYKQCIFVLQSLCNGAGNAAKSKYKLICTIYVVQCGVLDLGFRDVKAQLLACMKDGAVSHDERSSIDVKNLLATGQVTLDEVSEVIRAARGNHYRCSPHHVVDGIDVHIITINRGGTSWYIKWYFLEPQSIFISVHY